MKSAELMEIFGQDTCDGCDEPPTELSSYCGSYLCRTCCDEQAVEDGLDALMNGEEIPPAPAGFRGVG